MNKVSNAPVFQRINFVRLPVPRPTSMCRTSYNNGSAWSTSGTPSTVNQSIRTSYNEQTWSTSNTSFWLHAFAVDRRRASPEDDVRTASPQSLPELEGRHPLLSCSSCPSRTDAAVGVPAVEPGPDYTHLCISTSRGCWRRSRDCPNQEQLSIEIKSRVGHK